MFCTKCLGCSRFMFYNGNILEYSSNNHDTVIMGKIIDLKSQENKLKEEICSLMNSFGGVILFDCKLSKREVFAMGEVLTEGNKSEYIE